MLDGRQRNRFDREGYLVLEDFVDPVQCARLRTRALELVAELVPFGSEMTQVDLPRFDDQTHGCLAFDVRLSCFGREADQQSRLTFPLDHLFERCH